MAACIESVTVVMSLVFVHFARAQKELHVGVLIPLSGQKSMGSEVVAAAYLSVQNINSDQGLTYVRSHGYNFSITVGDTSCDTGQGLQRVIEMTTGFNHSGRQVEAFVGPSCDNVCETAGLVAGRYNIPMVSYGCEESKLSNHAVYPTFARTTSSFDKMSGFLQDILHHYGWKRIMLVTTSSQVWLETEAELLHQLMANGFNALQWNIQPSDWSVMIDLLLQKGQQSYVFLLLMFGADVLKFMQAAKEAQLLGGHTVFMAIDFANMGKRIGDPVDGPHLTGLLDITMDVTPDSATFRNFVEAIQINSTLSTVGYSNNNDSCTHYEFGIHAGLLHDAMLLYATAVDSVLRSGQDPRNGAQVARFMYNVSIEGVTGRVRIKADGSRESQFMLHNLRYGCYMPVARSADDCTLPPDVEPDKFICEVKVRKTATVRGRAFIYLNNTVIWPDGTENIPLGRPECGWTGDVCEDRTTIIIACTASLAGALLLVVFGGILYWRHEVIKRDSSRAWIIHSEDLRVKDKGIGKSRVSFRNVSPSSRTIYSDSRFSHTTDSSYGQVYAEHYLYHNEEVAGKRIVLNSKAGIVVTKQLSKDVNHVIQLGNANVCKFYGVCVDVGQEMTIWEYCRKGSVQDVIHNDKKYLEDMPFKISFMNDITKGLRYLHHSRLGHHGRVKSANVLVDNRWTCKLTHMCIPGLSRPDAMDEENTNYERFLSTAPEMLQNPSLSQIGTKAADIYSLGIVILEILTVSEIREAFQAAHVQELLIDRHRHRSRKKRKHKPHLGHVNHSLHPQLNHDGKLPSPFESSVSMEHGMDAQEIISRLKQGGTFPFRPLIPDYIDHKTKNVIMECWREQPEERPSIDHVTSLIRHISIQYRGKDKSLMEQMLDKVTREADMQAQELEEEKNKSDQLLYQMLPPTVADCLKKQIEVKPETFQSATVYFSDIQGFTELSSVSEPLEIVDFLNDVYYKFDTIIERYQVYKVETIGDAYVVCSGVPVRVESHACEIAKMALHIMSCSSDLKVLHRPEQKFHMRIGLHSGPVAAGVVGRTMPRYCLFGDTVNTASRMESTSIAGHIQISQQCKDLLDKDGGFNYTAREPIQVKGKGLLQTYFLISRDGFHPVDSSHIDIRSMFSSHIETKPQVNGGGKHVTNLTNNETPTFIQQQPDSLKPIESMVSVIGSKLALNDTLTEVNVA